MSAEQQDEREDKATEAIISGILRGYGEKEWKQVFAEMDKEESKSNEDQP